MKKTALLLALLTSLIAADTTAQSMAEPGAPALGRLFASPGQRAELDARRNNGTLGAAGAPATAPAAIVAPPPPPAAPVELNGIVKRSGGTSTIWLNNVAQSTGNDAFVGARAATPALNVNTPSGRTVILKPGQSYDANDGSVKEVHER
ncbi:MAG TPA: hypothetical protein VGP06_13535 [Janthinobacterium sp.]|jgi:hypothetical protein|nr:hypothetical protein [Janthinobacterium sp.]